MALVLTTAADPGEAYWAPVSGGLEFWSENGAGDLYPNTSGTQNLGLPDNLVNRFYGHTFLGVNAAPGATQNPFPGSDSIPRMALIQFASDTPAQATVGDTGLIAGRVYATSTGDAILRTQTENPGSIALGNVFSGSTGDSVISAGSNVPSTYNGASLALGSSYAYGAGASAISSSDSSIALGTISSQGDSSISSSKGSTSHGSIAVYEATSSVDISSNLGSRSFGRIYNTLGYTQYSFITSSQGSLAFGFSSNSTLLVYATLGSAAFGSATAAGDTVTINADSSGSLAFGAGDSGSGTIRSTGGFGGLAFGKATDGGVIQSYNGDGSMAFGYSDGNSLISSSGTGSLAFGAAQTGSYIEATAEGSLAFGSANSGGVISATNTSFAGGRASGYTITATALGSFAFGNAGVANIEATAINSVQFFEGTNSLTNSVQIGGNLTKIRLIGNTAVVGSPTNGDIWCDGTDVFVRTGGVTKNMSSIP